MLQKKEKRRKEHQYLITWFCGSEFLIGSAVGNHRLKGRFVLALTSSGTDSPPGMLRA